MQLAWLAPRRDALSSPAHLVGYGLAVARFEARLHAGADTARVTARFGRIAEKLSRRLDKYEQRVAPAGEEGPSFGAVLASLVEDQVNALVARVEAIRDAADVEGAHRARIEGKRLRYLLEPLRVYPGADGTEAVFAVKRLQDVLGELHDAHVLGAGCGAERSESPGAGACRWSTSPQAAPGRRRSIARARSDSEAVPRAGGRPC